MNNTPDGVPAMKWRAKMTKFTKLVGAAAILMGSGVASGAYADASATTCGQFAMMDDAGRLNYAHELLLWIADTANSEAAGAELIRRGPGPTRR
jgi:hypothetical protein